MSPYGTCASDYDCYKGKQICANKQMINWRCENGACSELPKENVQCCSNSDCRADQVCQGSTCIGGSGSTEPLNQTAKGPIKEAAKIIDNSNNNILIYVLIIATAMIIGFIIHAIILNGKKK